MKFISGLKKGDTIGITAPSSGNKGDKSQEIAAKLNEFGFNVKIQESAKTRYKGYLSNTDEVRAKNLQDLFLDDEVDAILCLRGGYGATRMMKYLDYDLIAKHPKIFIGYSDITALHLAFNQLCGFTTYHGPMASKIHEWSDFTFTSLFEALNFESEYHVVNPQDEKIMTIVEGECSGVLVGGNLSLIIASLGTEYEIDTKDKVVYIEDINEVVCNVDRMLTQLCTCGKFDDCAGIVFGDFCECNKENEDDFTIEELITDRIKQYNKPCIYNVQSGHCEPMLTVVMGAMASLDATNKQFIIKK